MIWAAVIFIASANSNPYKPLPASWSEPSIPAEPLSPTRDELLGRVLHAAEYVVLAVLTTRSLVWKGEMRPILLLAALGLAVLYALSDEIHQLFVPGRSFELHDLALDSLGAIIGLMVFAFLHTYRSSRKAAKIRNYE